ncbi:MAG: hypothetical protein JO113_01355 [Candidatus Eremiobacteraeota bacterium]|nr:hypothetical protein [Candidatus Eremiobacteraeota bacterium]
MTLVGQLTGFAGLGGECVDAKQNVWIVDSAKAQILEYRHGGSKPIATLYDSGYEPLACSIDPKSGALAVTNARTPRSRRSASVSIYSGASGSPSVYSVSEMAGVLFLSYDASGNLFVDGYGRKRWDRTFAYAELPAGATQFKNLRINGIPDPGDMHPVGDEIALEGGRVNRGTVLIYQLAGDKIARLTKCEFANPGGPQTFAFAGRVVLIDIEPIIYTYRYPQGGAPIAQDNLGTGSLYLVISRGRSS